MPTFSQVLSILDNQERELPLVVDLIPYNGGVAHIKLRETGSVVDTARELSRGYGHCEVMSFKSADAIEFMIARRIQR